MARDVEANVTASDKTGPALASVERRFKNTQDKLQKQQERSNDLLGKGFLSGLDKVAPKAAQALADVFAKGGAAGGPLLAAGLAVGLPLIGASVSAAVIGGVGLGGVVGGVALAAKDPRVAGAGKVLGKTLMDSLEQSGESFVEPVLRNIDKVEARFATMAPRLDRIFKNSSRFLDPLVDGALRAVDGISKGIDSLIANAGPVMTELGDELGDIGEALGEMLHTIGGGSEDAAAGLDFLGTVIAESLIITGRFLRILSETFGFLVKLQNSIGDVIPALDLFADKQDRVGGSGTFAGEGAQKAAAGFNTESAAAAELTVSLEQAENAVRGVYQANNDLYSSTTTVAEAVARATGTIKENGRTLELNSKKGRENREALSSVAGALQRNYDAYVKVNGVGAGSAKVAADLRGSFVRLATQAGLSANAANNLADQLLNIPSKRDTKITAPTAAARAEIKALQQKVDALRGKTVTVTVRANTSQLNKVNNQLERNANGRYSAAAYWAGTDVNGGGMSRTGGPTPVSVTSDVNVLLDGRPFHAAAVTAAQRVADRSAWRQKVGTR